MERGFKRDGIVNTWILMASLIVGLIAVLAVSLAGRHVLPFLSTPQATSEPARQSSN